MAAKKTAAPKTPAKKVASTAVRKTSVPPKAAAAAATPAPREITFDMISVRAYEIYCSGTGGSEQDNWHRAERELRGV